MLGTASTCAPKEELPSRETLIQQALEKKLEKYERSHAKRCRDKVLKKAKELVDSIMLAEARQVLVVDSIPRPPKPTKPEAPEPLPLEDTLELAPLLPLDSLSSR